METQIYAYINGWLVHTTIIDFCFVCDIAAYFLIFYNYKQKVCEALEMNTK